uniref:2-aminomuconic acid semialdehyde dehydrogenase n=1 Tax=Ectopseudomonas oleovorans TaxID=301 RepID=O68391_ECTOL|nr:2-aminomuconic acid semialdehyde dehydrogenase [Pseudomonas oleovorans]
MKHYRNYVNGKWTESSRTFDDVSPVDGSLVAIVHEASRELVDEAVKSGHQALSGEWGRTTATQRVALLRRIADEMERRQGDFLAAEMADTGKPHSMASSIDVPRGIANFRTFADILATAPVDSHRLDLADGAYALNYSARKPLGVVGVISPWNLPLLLMTWKVAPALACGNTVVVKPSEDTPGTATLLAEVMEAAGVPPGVFNLVHGFGPNSAGEFISSHPDISAITFTGESRTGTTIMRAAAEGVKPVSFELGGKNAAIIFADCDFDKMLDTMMRALFLNSGQVCLCSERVYVERPLYDRFCAALVERIKGMKIDWPQDPPGEQGRPEDPHRSGHRGYPCPSPARRPRAGRCRPGDLRRIPRAQPGCRPSPGADSQWPRTVARRAAAESAGDVGDPGGRASCGAARRSAGGAQRGPHVPGGYPLGTAGATRRVHRAAGAAGGAPGAGGGKRQRAGLSSRPGRDPPRSRRLARSPWRTPRGAALPAAWRARPRRPARRHRAGVAGHAQGGAGDQHRRDQPDHRRRTGGDRRRPGAGAALRSG